MASEPGNHACHNTPPSRSFGLLRRRSHPRIVEKHGYGEREALALFLCSRTYQMLSNPEMRMTQFGPDGIFDIWETERITGDPLRSAYLRMD